jgi:peptidoglycan/LPS O-acetylase OafA/YrhL
MQPAKQHSFYYPELDGLRFLAFLLVFVHNAPVVLPFSLLVILHDYGWIGVDLFLCLSAFLLTRLLINEYGRNGSVNIRYFYVRRILRIWPLYFLVALLATAVTTHIYNWTPATFLRFVGLMTFTDNFMAAWLGFNTFAFAPHLWTISYEEQFYVIIPWALRWLLKRGEQTKWMVCAGIFTAFMGLRALLIYLNVPYPAIYVLPFTHFVAILGGFMLGLGLLDKAFKNVPRWFLLLLGFAYLGVVISLPNKEIPGWHLIITYPGISVTLIVYSIVHGEGTPATKLLKNKVIAYLGKISYGLYMYHFFGLNVGLFLAESMGLATQSIEFALIILSAGLVVTFAYAEVSYRFIEKPFLKLKERFTFIPSRPV